MTWHDMTVIVDAADLTVDDVDHIDTGVKVRVRTHDSTATVVVVASDLDGLRRVADRLVDAVIEAEAKL